MSDAGAGRERAGSGDGSGERPITVLVVDDHQTFAELLALALETQPSLSYVGHASTSAQALDMVDRLRPDVILMDVQLPDLDGITTTERVLARRRDTRVVILTAYPEPTLVARAAAAGACGFLPKDGSLRDVLHALHTAHRGGMIVSPHLLAGGLAAAKQQRPARPDAGLTPRETEVLQLMGAGMDVRGIAGRLGITTHTCRGYVKAVLAKLDAHSQLEAVVTAIRRGLLHPGPPPGP